MVCGSVTFKSKERNGSDPGAECMVSVTCVISIGPRQDQHRVGRKAHVEQGPSLLVGRIAGSRVHRVPLLVVLIKFWGPEASTS